MYLLILSLFAAFTFANSEVEFKHNAKQFLRVNYSKMGSRWKYTEMSVSYKPHKMITTTTDLEISKIKVEMKQNDGCWYQVDGRPIERGRAEVLWRIKIFPCKVVNSR